MSDPNKTAWPTTTTWPELWALWIPPDDDGTPGDWVVAADGPCDGPQVFFTREEAEITATYNLKHHDILCEPRRITVTP